MDKPNNQPAPQPNKKLLIFILIVVLSLGALAAYYYRQRPESTSKTEDTSTSTEDTEPYAASPSTLKPVDPTDVSERYAYSQSRLDKVDDMSATEKVTLYTSLAYDGAALDKREARDYAKEALELVDEPSDDATKAIHAVLTEISNGNYATAKSLVLQTTEE